MTQTTACRGEGCTALVRWVVTVGDKRMPLDPDPHPEGNVELVEVAGSIRARVLGGGDERPADGVLFRPHWQTCPASPQFRERVARTVPRCTVCREPMNETLARRELWTTHPACDPTDRAVPARAAAQPVTEPETAPERAGDPLW